MYSNQCQSERMQFVKEEQRKYKIFEGVDHFKNKPLYQINGINNDYVGEWHTNKKSLNNELKTL